MYNRMHITEDKRMLKLLLLELGAATATYKDSHGNFDQRDFIEILVFYDNTNGNVSFGVRRTHQEETTINYFPMIFRGLHRFMQGRVLLYICFKAIFGCAFQVIFSFFFSNISHSVHSVHGQFTKRENASIV